MAAEMAAEMPGAELVVDESAGHLIMLERPELVTARLQDLIDRAAVSRCGKCLA